METNIIYNEDCIEGMKKLPDKCIDLVVADPPYNADYGFENDNLPNDEFYKFTTEWIRECERISKNGVVYIVDTKYSLPFYRIPAIQYHHTYTHFKNNAMRGMYGGFANKTEVICFTSIKPRKSIKFPNDIWTIPIVPQDIDHPTPKPVELIDVILEKFTEEEDVILDPFIGSGTLAVSCLKNNRNFIGFELEEKYYNVAMRRIGKFDKRYYEQLPEKEKPRELQLF